MLMSTALLLWLFLYVSTESTFGQGFASRIFKVYPTLYDYTLDYIWYL